MLRTQASNSAMEVPDALQHFWGVVRPMTINPDNADMLSEVVKDSGFGVSMSSHSLECIRPTGSLSWRPRTGAYGACGATGLFLELCRSLLLFAEKRPSHLRLRRGRDC